MDCRPSHEDFSDMTRIRERVARGAALLDKESPGWVDVIHLPRLDMADPCYCILGQLYGEYGEGCTTLFAHPTWADKIDYGFSTWSEEFPWLEQAWRQLIAARRAQSAVPAVKE